MRRGKARTWYPRRRTRYVVETEPVAHLDRSRITAVFPADPQLYSWIDLSGLPNRDLDERSHAVGVQAGERADRK